MWEGAFIYPRGDTSKLGVVRELKGTKVRVSFEDSPKKSKWVDEDDVVLCPSIAPLVKDLQFETKLHPDTKFVYVERDPDFQGDHDPGPIIECAEDIYTYFQGMGWLDTEHLVVGLLDTRCQLVGWKIVHKGAIDNVQASGKEMIKDATHGNARYLFFMHNHPSGDALPSSADEKLTTYVSKRLSTEDDLDLFDHVIIGRTGLDPESREERRPYYSFREEGHLKPIEPPEDEEEP